jgi:CspA family cold shock protein
VAPTKVFIPSVTLGLYKLPQFAQTVLGTVVEQVAAVGWVEPGNSAMAGSDGLQERPQEQTQSGEFASEANVRVFQVSGFVKWFDVTRGYGFIIPDSGLPDVLLHLSCLKRDGHEAPLEGTRVLCEAVERPKGIQCLRVLSVDTSTAIHPVERTPRTHVQVAASSDWVKVKVKWFNRARGFGFLTEGEGTPDIFVHMEVLRRTAIAELQPDETVYVRFGAGPKGLMAAEVRSSLADDRLRRTN